MGDGLEERVKALEARLSELEERVVAHTLESIWAHLQEEGLSGFPARVVEEVRQGGGSEGLAARVAALESRLDPAKLVEQLANKLIATATRPLMQVVDQRLDQIQAGRGGDPAAEERLIRIEQRLERLEVNAEA